MTSFSLQLVGKITGQELAGIVFDSNDPTSSFPPLSKEKVVEFAEGFMDHLNSDEQQIIVWQQEDDKKDLVWDSDGKWNIPEDTNDDRRRG